MALPPSPTPLTRNARPPADGVVGGTDTRAQQDDVLQVPPRDRNLAHFLAERLHLRRRCCFDERRVLGDRDGLCQRPHFERKCLPHRLAGAQRQSLVLIRLESRKLDPDRVRTRRERGQRKFAACVRDGFSRQRGALMRDRHGDAGKNPARAVLHDAVERGFEHLTARVARRQEKSCEGEQNGEGNARSSHHGGLLTRISDSADDSVWCVWGSFVTPNSRACLSDRPPLFHTTR